ncbi:hypothetical protein [Tessaracoccus massiliensis]|uniref:hypothetical protein n=1 Tax=Tessaracoccus massiliensis TaxID=1522311 RepID=UPI0011186623|nr:hypothetical protein [Tessaracoccus massiliensis]
MEFAQHVAHGDTGLGQFVRTDGWAFNNLTYLPLMTREAWGANPLANDGEWTASTNGRKWMTECDTARTGRDGYRSYAFVTVYEATATAPSSCRGPRSSGRHAQSQGRSPFPTPVARGSATLAA